MTRILHYTITEQTNILGYLKNRGYSHAIITHLKRTKNGICLNGRWAYIHEELALGDTLRISIIEPEAASTIQPSKLPLDLLYEDEDLLVINKPAHMPVHPSLLHPCDTLANALAYHYHHKGNAPTFRCVNRLDKDTSGLLIAAKNMLSASLLSNMIRERKIQREYLAVAKGLTPETGVITAPISRKDTTSMERCVDEAEGAYACTHFKRLRFQDGYSLLLLRLDTGRTHQIRVHLKHIGHPIPGDFLYHPDYTHINRQALHSHTLTFTHPISGSRMHFTTPLPPDMNSLFLTP